MTFDEVIGQEEVKQRLLQMVREERVPHALMLCGSAGCGKMALALAMASELLSIGSAQQSANTQAMLQSMQHPDLHFTYPTIKLPSMGSEHQPVSSDFATEWRELLMKSPYFSMDDWMTAMGAANQQAIITGAESDELARQLSLKSSQGGYKVSIIWLPERMNLTSANKLLKLLEEPPRQTVFIMLCEEPECLLETIRSRTQRIDVHRISTEAVEKALVQRRGLDEETAHRVARVANGSWLQAIETLSMGNENRGFLDMFIMLMRLAYSRNIKELKRWSETVGGYGREKQKRMLTYFMQQVRENFMSNFDVPDLNYMTQDEEEFSKKFGRFINEANIIDITELMDKAQRDIAQNANSKVVFFELALQMIILLRQK
ncbi:MAG: DNA polymerase III subunit delta [Prevotella sp.]|nr:DNA polymerase III subunit delta [Prevotella sp.]